LAWRQWHGDLVVFNPISGATHLLDIVGGEVLRALMEGPARAEELARRIAKLLEVECDDETVAAADRILENLDRLGLAEPAGPDAPRSHYYHY
jgi:PqqD family protein of HPr-rel-A system